ncbi:MAG: SDR family NAD(P)-dependent oxidoreductase [Phycisphaerae bacterium]|nr:SDR family NAD(P)-dependent oxidoreductase [Gemmatimonadaceae bacterium]
MKRVLVTGAAGFVGRWLCAALVREGWEVVATARSDADVTAAGVDGPWGTLDSVRWFTGDIRDAEHWATLFSETRPDAVINLAAISHVQQASADPSRTWEVNLLAPVRLLHEAQAQRARGVLDPTILLVGSAEQYGRQPASAVPFDEDTPQVPLTVYGASKAAQEVAGMQAHRATGLRVVAARPFPHSGAGQEPRFVIPAMVSRAEALRASGSSEAMLTGNLTPIRDFLHVSDVVAAYIALLRAGRPGTAYNVASGTGMSVRDVTERVLARVGLKTELKEDPALVRAVDVPVLVGNAARLMADTGWKAVRSFDDIIDDLLAYHRKHAATL